MNNVTLMGRLTKDPEVRTSPNGNSVARYTLAVNRTYKREGEPEADFINIVAFGKAAEVAQKYFRKGQQVAVIGNLQTSTYTDKDGIKRYGFNIIAEKQFFADSKRDSYEKDFTPTAEPVPEQFEEGDLPF